MRSRTTEVPSQIRIFRYSSAFIYLLLIIAIEVVLVSFRPGWGITLYGLLLLSLLIHAAIEKDFSRFLLGMSAIPVLRLVNYGLPIGQLLLPLQYLAVGVCMSGYVIVGLRSPEFSSIRSNFRPDKWNVQILIALSGVVIGYGQYLIAAPSPFVSGQPVATLILLAVALAFSLGLIEEMIFRGILLNSVADQLGDVGAIVYVSVIYTALYSQVGTALLTLLTLAVSFYYAFAVRKASGLMGVIASHAISAILYFVVLPLLAS